MLEYDTTNPRFALSEGPHRVIYSNVPATYDPSVGSQGWWKVKSKDWEYEEEYRIVSQLSECETKISDGKTIYLRHTPQDCVKAVFMGLKIEKVMKKRLREVCQTSGIDLFEAIFLSD